MVAVHEHVSVEPVAPLDDLMGSGSSGRELSEADQKRFEGYAAEMLGALGLELDTPGTADTPRRFVQALIDATDGYEGDPKLVTVFPTECHADSSCDLAQIVEGPDPVLRSVRAPRAAVLRRGVSWATWRTSTSSASAS